VVVVDDSSLLHAVAPAVSTARATAALMTEFLFMSAPQFVSYLEGGPPKDLMLRRSTSGVVPQIGRFRASNRPIWGRRCESRGVHTPQVST